MDNNLRVFAIRGRDFSRQAGHLMWWALAANKETVEQVVDGLGTTWVEVDDVAVPADEIDFILPQDRDILRQAIEAGNQGE